jgi:hypothetical protein
VLCRKPLSSVIRAGEKMIKKSKYLLFLLLTLSCSPISHTKHDANTALEPSSILSVESNLVEVKYIITGYTNSIPPQVIKKEDSYIYDLLFKLSFNKKFGIWNDPVHIYLNYVDNDIQPIKYDEELSQVKNGIFPGYVTRVEVKRKGDIQATLGYLDINGEILFDKTNPFCTKVVTLE